MSTATTGMSLYQRIKDDLETSFRAGDKVKTNLLRTLASDATTEARKKEDRLPTDQEVVALLRKFVANARTNAESFDKLNRAEAAEAARNEVSILTPYLPPEVSEADVRSLLSDLIAADKIPAGNAGVGAAMKALKDKYGNAFDGKVLKPVVELVLAERQ